MITDTIPTDLSDSTKIERISVAPLFAEAISRIHDGSSVSALFSSEKVREIVFEDD
jgi:phosphoribosylpyrophosphate synthetase